jgi:hypothetical protein
VELVEFLFRDLFQILEFVSLATPERSYTIAFSLSGIKSLFVCLHYCSYLDDITLQHNINLTQHKKEKRIKARKNLLLTRVHEPC